MKSPSSFVYCEHEKKKWQEKTTLTFVEHCRYARALKTKTQ